MFIYVCMYVCMYHSSDDIISVNVIQILVAFQLYCNL